MIERKADPSDRAAKVVMEANPPIKKECDYAQPTPKDHGKLSPQSSKEAEQEQDFDVIISKIRSPNLKIKSSVCVQRTSCHGSAAFCVPTVDLARKVVSEEEHTEWKDLMPCRVEQKFHTVNSPTLMAKKVIASRRDRTTCHPDPTLGLLCVLFFVILGPVEADTLKLTGQKLPKNCLTLLKEHNKCFNRSVSFEKNHWIELNKICCDNYTGIFHCQHYEEGGKIYSMAACLPEETVPAGKRGKLVLNGTGYPKLDLEMDCPDDTFRDHSMNSSFILHPSCERKTKAEPEEEKWCDGGPSADDLIICSIGYDAENCPYGHNSHDFCLCIPLQCGEGSAPNRIVTGSCSENNISIKYECTNLNSTLDVSATTPRHQSDSASGERGIKGTSPATNANHSSTSAPPSSDTSAITGGVLGAMGLLVLIVIVGFCIYRKSRCGSYKIPTKPDFDKVDVVFERVEEVQN